MSDKTQIMKMEDLNGFPSVGGTVKVPLADIDRMRMEYLKTKQLADQLSAHQKQVLVTITEKKKVEEFKRDEYHSAGGYYVTDTKYVEISRNYVNLENLRDPITQEIRDEYKDSLEKTREELKHVRSHRVRLEEELAVLKSDYSKVKHDLSAKESRLDLVHKDLGVRIDQVLDLRTQLEKWKKKKSFWYWLNSSVKEKTTRN